MVHWMPLASWTAALPQTQQAMPWARH